MTTIGTTRAVLLIEEFSSLRFHNEMCALLIWTGVKLSLEPYVHHTIEKHHCFRRNWANVETLRLLPCLHRLRLICCLEGSVRSWIHMSIILLKDRQARKFQWGEQSFWIGFNSERSIKRTSKTIFAYASLWRISMVSLSFYNKQVTFIWNKIVHVFLFCFVL